MFNNSEADNVSFCEVARFGRLMPSAIENSLPIAAILGLIVKTYSSFVS